MTRSLFLALGLAAAGSLVTFALVLDGPSAAPSLGPPSIDALDGARARASSELLSALDAVEPDSPRDTAPRIETRTHVSTYGACHLFDVTFVPVDDLGFPVPNADVQLALAGRRMNRMGRSDWRGELHVTWSGGQPALNGFVRTMSSDEASIESRIVLTAGAPMIVRIGHDGPSSDRPAREQQRQALYDGSYEADPYGMHVLSDDAPRFVDGVDGQDAFVDRDQLARIWGEDGRGTMRGTSMCCGIGGPSRDETTLSVRVRDERGNPLTGIHCVVYLPSGGPERGTTDDQGRFEIRKKNLRRADILVGGRDREFVSRSFHFDKPPETWDIELKPVPVVRGRLLGAGDVPLCDWVVQAHDADGRAGFLSSARTGSQGEFVLGSSGTRRVELRARPSTLPWSPAVRIAARHALGSEPDSVFVVPQPAPASALWRIDLPVDVEGLLPHSRLVRVDTGETAGVGPCRREVLPGPLQRFTFRADNLIAGEYALEILAPGCAPGGGARVQVSGNCDLGAFEPTPGARIELPDGPDMAWVTAVSLVQGMRVRSDCMSLPNRFVLAPGDHELCFSVRTREPQNATLVRRVRVENGRMIELDALSR